MAPSALPAPTTVCNSSIKRMISPSDDCTSFSTAFSRSSNSPRNLAPAISAPMSSDTTRFFFKPFGDVAAHDALRQPFDNGGLPDARLANQHRVVLGAPRENLDHAPDLFVASDHRIELALRGQLGQIAAVLFERFVGGLRVLAGHPLAARALPAAPASAVRALSPNSRSRRPEAPAVVRQGEQDVLHRDELVFHPLGFVFGLGEQLLQPGRDVHLIRDWRLGRKLWGACSVPAPAGLAAARRARSALLQDGGSQTALLFQQAASRCSTSTC